MSNSVSSQTVSKKIEPFSGNSNQFKEWIKSLEKHAFLCRLPEQEIKQLAYHTARSHVSDVIQRRLIDFPDESWGDFKKELTARFGEIIDVQHACTLLRQIRQKPDENVQLFSERLLALAEDAYGDQEGGIQRYGREIIGIFIDGLTHDYIRLKLMRENPTNFPTAVRSALAEQNLRKRFTLRTGRDIPLPKPYHKAGQNRQQTSYQGDTSVPMDVDYYRPKKICYNCQKPGHLAKNCRQNSKRNESNYTKRT